MANILTLLRSKPGFVSLAGATEDQITDAESALGLTFSEEYRTYLANFGAASFDGHELTGIVKSPHLNVVNVTFDEKQKHPDIPDDWYVVEQLHIDDVSIWQSSNGEVFQLLPGAAPMQLATTLASYVNG